MARLILMCGPAFSGKTTLARKIVDTIGCAYVSLDEILGGRGIAAGFDVPEGTWAEAHRQAKAEVRRLLARGETVLVDDTNCFRFLRDGFREEADRAGAATVVVSVRTPVDENLRRAPESVREALTDQVRDFEWPEADEPSVDWDPRVPVGAWLARLGLAGGTS